MKLFSSAEPYVGPPERKCCGEQPDCKNGDQARATSRTFSAFFRDRPEFSKKRRGDQTNGDSNADGNDQQVVEVAQHRNEIRDQINRGKRIGGDAARYNLRQYWRSPVPCGKPQRYHVPLQRARPRLQLLQPSTHAACFIQKQLPRKHAPTAVRSGPYPGSQDQSRGGKNNRCAEAGDKCEAVGSHSAAPVKSWSGSSLTLSDGARANCRRWTKDTPESGNVESPTTSAGGAAPAGGE